MDDGAAACELDGEAGVTTIVSWTAIRGVLVVGSGSSLEAVVVVVMVGGVAGGVASDRETAGSVADLGKSWDLAWAAWVRWCECECE